MQDFGGEDDANVPLGLSPADQSFLQRLKEVEQAQRRAKEQRVRFLADTVRSPPVPNDLLPELSWLFITDFRKVMREHPGHLVEARRASLWSALDAFRAASVDLFSALNRFNAFSLEPHALSRARRREADAITRAVSKEVFAASAGAYALVEHHRRFIKMFDASGYRERLARDLDAGENSFVLAIRKNLQHLRYTEPRWVVRTSIDRSRTTHFELTVEELLTEPDFDLNLEAQSFLHASGDTIDIGAVFSSYGRKVDAYYAWLGALFEERLPGSVSDYRRVMREHSRVQARASWRLILTQMVKPETDPYAHLSSLLSSEERADVLALPHRSREQVDQIIRVLDENGACDDELRALAYGLFGIDSPHDAIGS